MNVAFLLMAIVFGTEYIDKTENVPKTFEQNKYSSILVKIEENEYNKKTSSKYIGVTYNEKCSKWRAFRRSKNEKKMIYNGSHNDEETAAIASDTLARNLMATGKQNLKLNFPEIDCEVYREEKPRTSNYIGVTFNKNKSRWRAQRWSKNENKSITNGYYKDAETAAHASDTLARKLVAKGEDHKFHKLNFSDDDTEIYPVQKTKSSMYIGVSYNREMWFAQRWSKNESKNVQNGCYKNEERAAHASDTLARKLRRNGEQNHELNFPDDHTEIHPEKTKSSIYIGVTYNEIKGRWIAYKKSKHDKKQIQNGSYSDEETAAHASDTLARNLIENGEKNHKLNFPDDHTEVYSKFGKNKRKRQEEFKNYENLFEKFD